MNTEALETQSKAAHLPVAFRSFPSMATKKRKVDEEDELLNAPNRPVVYTPAPAEEINGDEGPADDEAEAEEEEEEDVGKVLEPLSHDQLVSLLRFAASSNSAVLAEICRVADLDPAHRKLFVHGLGWETSNEGLRAAFASYGDIDDCRVVFDKASGRSKGYGFVLFCNRKSAQRALRQPQKLIEGRMTSCQLASTGPTSAASGGAADRSHHHNPSHTPAAQQDNLPRKIYVGNVHSNIDGGRLLEFFSQYGEIEEGPIGFDRHTGKPKGYALFIYRTLEGAQRALEEPTKYFEGHQLICHKAMDGKSKGTPAANAAVVQQNPALNMAAYNGSGYGTQQVDMGLAQQAAMFGQGILGMTAPQAFGQGLQPNAAAIAMLAAAAQNQAAAFGVTPAMLASLNPAFAAALGAAGSQQAMAVPTTVPQTASTQNYVMGSMGYQTPSVYQGNPGFQAPLGFQESSSIQGTPAFQGPPGFQGTQQISQQGAAVAAATYQGAPLATNPMPRPSAGSLGGYGPH